MTALSTDRHIYSRRLIFCAYELERTRRLERQRDQRAILPMDKPTRPNLFTRLFKGGAK